MDKILSISWGFVVNDKAPKAPAWAKNSIPLITRERTFPVNGQELAFWQEGDEPKLVAVWIRKMNSENI